MVVIPALEAASMEVVKSMSVDAAEVARRSGTTTFVDAGSAGPGIFHGFRRHVIEPSPLRIIPYLNVSFPGIFALSAAVAAGECADMRLLDPRECVRVIEANRDLIAGVKVRVGAQRERCLRGGAPRHCARGRRRDRVTGRRSLGATNARLAPPM